MNFNNRGQFLLTGIVLNVGVEHLGQSEIGDLDGVVAVDENVGCPQIAMDKIHFLEVGHSLGDLKNGGGSG